MKRIQPLSIVIAAVIVGLAGSSLLGCSKSSSPTNPSGGGTGSGNTFNSGTLTAPADFVHVFPAVDSIGYHCNFHVSMGMIGSVKVVATGPDSAVVTANGITFSPSVVSVRPGGYVHWSIIGGTHTVTSD
jgi:plastocyanin